MLAIDIDQLMDMGLVQPMCFEPCVKRVASISGVERRSKLVARLGRGNLPSLFGVLCDRAIPTKHEALFRVERIVKIENDRAIVRQVASR